MIRLIAVQFKNPEAMTKIETEAQYQWALRRVEELFPLVAEDAPENDPLRMELQLLGNLVADYDEEHYPVGTPSLIEVMKLRMYEMGLTQTALAKLIGVSPSRICEYLSGKKEPTLKQGRVISQKLNIDANIVLGV